MTITCPKCGNSDWKAIEQFTAYTPCTLTRDEDGSVQIEFDMRAELAREAATSVVLAYACAAEDCEYTVGAAQLQQGGAQ